MLRSSSVFLKCLNHKCIKYPLTKNSNLKKKIFYINFSTNKQNLKNLTDTNNSKEFFIKKEISVNPSINTGDLVEIRRGGKTYFGIVVKKIDIGRASLDLYHVALATGHKIVTRASFIFFQVKNWAHSPFVNLNSTEILIPSIYISADVQRNCTESNINATNAIFHLQQFMKVVEGHAMRKNTRFFTLHQRLCDLNKDKITTNEAARFIFNVDDPSASELLTAHRFLMKNVKEYYLLSPSTLEHLSTGLFGVRPEAEVERLSWFEAEFSALAFAVHKNFAEKNPQKGLFYNNIPYTKFSKHVPWASIDDEPGEKLKTFINKCKIMTKFSNGKSNEVVTEFSASDLFFIDCLQEAALFNRSHKNIYAKICVSAIMTPLSSYFKDSTYVDNSTEGFCKLLLDLGVWPNNTSQRVLHSLKSGKYEFLDSYGQGEWVDKVAAEAKQYAQLTLGHIDKVDTTNSVIPSLSEKLTPPLRNENPFKKELISTYVAAGSSYVEKDDVAHLREPSKGTVYVIDDPTAKELDDGVSIEIIDKNLPLDPTNYWIHIHIADPTSLIKPTDPLALTSQLRGTSCYFPHTHKSMFPDILSNEKFNLSLGVKALTFSARLGPDGEIIDYKITPTILGDVKVVHYNDTDALLSWEGIYGLTKSSSKEKLDPWISQNLKAKAPLELLGSYFTDVKTLPIRYDHGTQLPKGFADGCKESLSVIQKITELHKRFRLSNGALMMDSEDSSVTVTPYDKIRNFSSKIDKPFIPDKDSAPVVFLDPYKSSFLSPAHNLVQESMIIAGRVAAKFCYERNLPVPYRGQMSPQDFNQHNCVGGLYTKHSITPIAGSRTVSKPPNESFRSFVDSILKNRNPSTGTIPFNQTQSLLSCMPSATLDLRPIMHFAMGLNGINPSTKDIIVDKINSNSKMIGYVKATSPLRRFTDMIVHWQIKSSLLNEKPVFTKKDLFTLIKEADRKGKLASAISNLWKKSWHLEWIKRREIFFSNTGADPLYNSETVWKDPHRGLGLSPIKLFGSTPELKKSVSFGPMYTCVICDTTNKTSNPMTIVVELGFRTFITSTKKLQVGDIVKGAFIRVDPIHGTSLMQVVEEF
ncbi:hypothetical protein HDU92_001802 [Lobulomyces angularis]|nr:hypothetical protein HDU92_001802 [Lobulomyces angularis]